MIKNLVVALVTLFPLCSVHGQLIEDTNIIQDYYDPTGLADFNLVVLQSPTGSITCVYGDISVSGSDATFSFTQICLDEASDWYVADFGDAFNEQTISDGNFDVLVRALPDGFETGSLEVKINESFYLGVNTGEGWTGDWIPNRDQFGWAEFQITENAELVMLDNAVAYDLGGIVIGRNIVIPEPGLASVLALALIAAPNRRKR